MQIIASNIRSQFTHNAFSVVIKISRRLIRLSYQPSAQSSSRPFGRDLDEPKVDSVIVHNNTVSINAEAPMSFVTAEC